VNAIARPCWRWLGNKHDLLDQLRPLRPRSFRAYHEPFLGAGAMFWDVARTFNGPCYLSDANADLVLTYRVIRDEVDRLIALLGYLAARPATAEAYYDVRGAYNKHGDAQAVERAAWFIYLMQTCFNGLHRTGPRGFNAAWGKRGHDTVLDAELLRACSNVLNRGNVHINVGDWQCALDSVQSGDYVFFDSPYVPASATAKFTKYADKDFTERDQRDLAAAFRGLVRHRAQAMASNSDTPLVRDLYAGLDIAEVTRGGRMNCRGDRRGRVTELVIRGGYST
jgi:DNA adenine methylase